MYKHQLFSELNGNKYIGNKNGGRSYNQKSKSKDLVDS